jgi:hypothetical protein
MWLLLGCFVLAPFPAESSGLSDQRALNLYQSLLDRLHRVKNETTFFCQQIRADRKAVDDAMAAAQLKNSQVSQRVFAVMRAEAAAEGVLFTALNPSDYGLPNQKKTRNVSGAGVKDALMQVQHACTNLLGPLTMGIHNFSSISLPTFHATQGGFASPLVTAQIELEALVASLKDDNLMYKSQYVVLLGQSALGALSKMQIQLSSNGAKLAKSIANLHTEFSSVVTQAQAFKLKLSIDLSRLQILKAAVVKAQATLKARALKQALLGPFFRQLQHEYKSEAELLLRVQTGSREQLISAQEIRPPSPPAPMNHRLATAKSESRR